MWHLFVTHQQESFLPFSSRQSLSCCLSHMAKGRPQSRVVLTLAQAAWAQPPPPKPRGPLWYGCPPGFKSQRQSNAPPFPTPPTIGPSGQHSRILPALLGCQEQDYSKSRQVWPCGVEPIFSKLSCRCCNQGELPPSYILGCSHSQPSGSKHGHSYLTYLRNQLKVIDT